jgi:hypothetical protein
MKSLADYRITILFIIMALILAACGGEETANDQTLPTIAPTFDTSAGPPINETGPEQTPDTPFDLSSPPGADSSTSDTNLPTVTDFSTLSVGDNVRVVGIVSFEEDPESSEIIALITDNQGNQIILTGFPLPMIESLDGQEVSQVGTIEPAPEGDTRLVFNSSGQDFTGPDTTNAPSFDGSLPPGITEGDRANAGPLSFNPEFNTADYTMLSLELEPDMTALQVHDALLLELADDLIGAELIEITGSPFTGWILRFIRDGNYVIYFVTPDGTVQQSPLTPFDSVPGAEPLPIDRSRVVVDSDTAASILTAADSGPIVALVLRATAEGDIVWTLDGFPADPVDATVAP